MASQIPEEMAIFAERYFHFMNLWTIYKDMLSGRYVPSHIDEEWSPQMTTMLLLYAYFYSLIEDSRDGLNGFRIWREHFPSEEAAIAAVEEQVMPFRDRLRIFRNKLGFHGSRTRVQESAGCDLFAQHSGTDIWNAMKNFKSLAAALFAHDLAERGIGKHTKEQVRNWLNGVAECARQNLPVSTVRAIAGTQ
jgi:hypothetical protein